MLHYAVVFFVIALIAALFGFGGIAVGAAEIAKVLSAALGAQALTDVDGMRQRVRQVKDERARLQTGLQALGLEVRDSAANFLLVQTGRSAAPALLKKGLVVRTFPATSLLAEYIRVTVRRPAENDRLVAALMETNARS